MRSEAIYLELQVYAGASIEDTCARASEIANFLQIHVWFSFNGVRVLVRPGADLAKTVRAWSEALSKGYTHASEAGK